MRIVHDIEALRAQVRAWRLRGETVSFVPTMGNLHGGHASLVEAAQRCADRVVVSIFVNPTQFGEGEDFSAYPRTLEDDCALVRPFGVDLLFAPSAEEMYPETGGPRTRVDVPGLTDILCGKSRPGHFVGVATVVAKLFGLVQPDVAVFGRKDFQQMRVIERVVHDLNMPVRIIGAETVREADGLAKSSRNTYLDETERGRAPAIHAALAHAVARLQAEGMAALAAIEDEGRAVIDAAGLRTDYFTARRATDLQPPSAGDRHLVVLAAAWLGRPRLIDNLEVTIAR